MCVAGLAAKRSPGKVGVKRRREGVQAAGPARTMQAKKQRVVKAPQAVARQAARLAAHARQAPVGSTSGLVSLREADA